MNNLKYKLNQKVRVPKFNDIGTIVDVDAGWSYPYEVEFDSGVVYEEQLFCDEDLEPVFDDVKSEQRDVVYPEDSNMDIYVYDNDNNKLLFEILAVSNSIRYDLVGNVLTIKTPLIDTKLMEDVLNGEYRDKSLRVMGKMMCRVANPLERKVTTEEKTMTIEIQDAKIYKLTYVENNVVLDFRFKASENSKNLYVRVEK